MAATLRLLGVIGLDAVRAALRLSPSYIKQVAVPGELRSYPYARFDFYREDICKEVLADQLAFLSRVLGD